MRRIIFTAIIGILACISAPHARAQQDINDSPELAYRQTYLATPHYNEMVRDALRNKSPHFDFMQFRTLYARTRQYDPMGKKTLDEMNNLAYVVLNDEDPGRAQGALFAYQMLVSNHLANIDVVMQALSLAKQDKRFGNPAFFEWVKDGLIKTVIISGDGYTLQGAYDVITLSEETILFRYLGFKPLQSQVRKEGTVYYDMCDVEEEATGKKRAVFVNTTIPMEYLDALKKVQNQNLSIDLSRQ